MAVSSLADMIKMVRRLTKRPSPSQISDDEITEFINRFVSYDMPEVLWQFTNKTTFKFYTEPYIAEYNSDNTAPELDDFKNKFLSFEAPVFVGGKQVPFYQNRDLFFAVYPKDTPVSFITNGDGVTTNFTGTLSSVPLIQGNNLFSSIDANNNTLALYDSTDTIGTTTTLSGSGTGTLNYVTGAYDITFSAAPAANTAINSQTLPCLPSRPQAVLYFDHKFVLRPVPDQAYSVELEAFVRPDDLVTGADPKLKTWFQYIAYGAAMKVYQESLDMEGVQMLAPEFERQLLLCNRQNVIQQSRNKVHTMFNSGFRNYNSPFNRF